MPRFDAEVSPERLWVAAWLKSKIEAAGGTVIVAARLTELAGKEVVKQRVSEIASGRRLLSPEQWRDWVRALRLRSVRDLFPSGLPPAEDTPTTPEEKEKE